MGQVLGDLVATVLGTRLGGGLRARLIARHRARLEGRGEVRRWALAHFVDAPDWRDMRGVIVKRHGHLTWRPSLWARASSFTLIPPGRWHVGVVDLTDARVIGVRDRRSAAHGDRTLLEVADVPDISHFLIEPAEAALVASMLRGDP